MKTETIPASPWPIIRWAFVALLFAGTVAIAVDQVKTREVKIAELERSVATLQKAKSAGMAEVKRQTANYLEAEGKRKVLADGINEFKAANDKVVAAYERQIALMNAKAETAATLAALKVGSTAPAQTQYVAPATAAPISPAGPAENPFWSTYAGTKVLAQIRTDAQKQWGTDYKMVEFDMKRQKEAYEQFLEYDKSYNRVTRGIVAEAVKQWGTDHKMVVFEIKKQLEAKGRLDGN